MDPGVLMWEIWKLLDHDQRNEAEQRLREYSNHCYREGYKDAVSNYAIWNNGERTVGVSRRPLNTVLEEVDDSPIPIR